MKTKTACAAALIVGLSILHLPGAFGQGALTPPPGVPAPTMKTLAQVEARTPIDPTQPGFALPYTIGTSGSYYLTKNLAVTSGNAIVISASNVTLDLNGFTISSSASPAGGTAIAPGPSLTDITILNGHIAGSFQHGIRYAGALGVLKNVRVEGVSVSGCSGDGINLGNFSSIVIDRCTVQQAGVQGIVGGSVNNSVAESCGSTGITAKSATNSVGSCSGSERGIFAKTAVNCVGESATGTGLDADSATGCWGQSTAFNSTGTGLNAATATGCYGYNSNGSGIGLRATSANGCYGFGNLGTGLNATTASGCYGYNSGGGGSGINALSVSNSYGYATNLGTGASPGISADTVIGCYGYNASFGSGIGAKSVTGSYGHSATNGAGIDADTASNCSGFSQSGTGLDICLAVSFSYGRSAGGNPGIFMCGLSSIALGCYGSSASGPGISGCYIANSCVGSGTPNVIANFKYNMPP